MPNLKSDDLEKPGVREFQQEMRKIVGVSTEPVETGESPKDCSPDFSPVPNDIGWLLRKGLVKFARVGPWPLVRYFMKCSRRYMDKPEHTLGRNSAAT